MAQAQPASRGPPIPQTAPGPPFQASTLQRVTPAAAAEQIALSRPPVNPVSYPNELPNLTWREDLRTARVGLTGTRLSIEAPQLDTELGQFRRWLTSPVQFDRPGEALQVSFDRYSSYNLALTML